MNEYSEEEGMAIQAVLDAVHENHDTFHDDIWITTPPFEDCPQGLCRRYRELMELGQ
jgi:hypothetical protein